jgi:PAS domain S-box-containing protein
VFSNESTGADQVQITEQQLKLAVEQAHRAATFQRIVAEASARLAESVEMGATAMSIVRLGLPEIADSCAVYELVGDGNLRGVEFANVDPAKTARLRKRLSQSRTVVPGRLLREVLEEGKPRIVPDLGQALSRDEALDPLRTQLISEVGIGTLMLLPLVARGRAFGVLAYACDESGRHFSPNDLELAQELARRASLALENARVYDAARRTAAELAGLISIAADAIITVEDDQRILMYNEGAEKMFGWKRDEVIGKPLDILIPERLRAIRRQHVGDFLAGSIAARRMGERSSVSSLRKDGVEFPAEAAISKLEIGGKRLLTVVMRDVTARLRLEREREAAIAMRDEIMGVVAHDLRSPLATIVTVASLVKARAGDGAVTSVEKIERAANRMNRLIQHLLDVTRIEASHLTVEPSRVSTRQIILDCVETQKAQIASASLEIEVQLASGVADVRADPDRLVQVLENLIGNAVKFSRKAGRVTVGARTSDRNVLFWV